MHPSSLVRCISSAVCLTVALSASASPAADQPKSARETTDPARIGNARSLGLKALTAMEKRDYARALDLFTRAIALYPAPTLLLGAARAHEKLGQLAEALESYDQLIAEKLEGDAPEAYLRAVASGRGEREALLPRVPRVSVRLEEGVSATVELDGVRLSPDTLATPHFLDPGKHELIARAANRGTFRQAFTLKEGDDRTFDVVLPERDAGPVAPATTAMGPAAPPRKPPTKDIGPRREQPTSNEGVTQRVLGWVTLGIGAGAAVAGGVFGVLAMDSRQQASTLCLPKDARPCSPQSGFDESYGDFKSQGNIATVAFIASGVFAGTGLVLLLTAPAPQRETGSVGAGSVGLCGSPRGYGLGLCGRL